ncbi:glycosyltransferase family A protein [Thiocapsa bogorovii]|uniref:glycosyltransferase family A protein n=1 Tax=Thiocapsa bogorovii TaxID=521689 RepID=UPI001E40DC9B|nr:glycosyltransferase family A protein [Thiocapsa bogorovii]UHD14557.1 glycosyltransferase family 2 protein [Thiocapsa bogorovii]
MPLISVVLRLSDGCPGLRDCLDSLLAQSLGVDRIEVCVDEEGRGEEALARLDSIASPLVLRHPPRRNSVSPVGPNAGLFAARGRIVFFMSGNDVLEARCLEEHHLTHEEFPDPHVCVLGYTRLRGEAARSPLMRSLVGSICVDPDRRETSPVSALDGSAIFGQIPSFKRDFLLEQGALNSRFPSGFEWSELGYRLHRVGLSMIRNADAMIDMTRPIGLENACVHCYRQGQSDRILVQVHPEPEARAWAQIDHWESEWELVEPIFGDIMKSARMLDRFAQERVRFELPIDELATRLLHRAYAAAFRANRLLGAIDGVVNGIKS